MAKKKATAPKKKKKEVDLDLLLAQVDTLTKLVGQLTENIQKPTQIKKIIEEIEDEVDEDQEQDPDTFAIHSNKKVNPKKGKLVTKAKCVPTDPGGNKEVDKIKYPERKRNTREPVQVLEKECEYCSRPMKYIEGVIQDYACQRCLTGRK